MRQRFGWVVAVGVVLGMASSAHAQVMFHAFGGYPTAIAGGGMIAGASYPIYPTYYASPGSWPYYVSSPNTVWPWSNFYSPGASSLNSVRYSYSSGYIGLAPSNDSIRSYGYSSPYGYPSAGWGYASAGSDCSCEGSSR